MGGGEKGEFSPTFQKHSNQTQSW